MTTDDEARADHAESCGCSQPIAVNVVFGGKVFMWLHVSTDEEEEA